MNKKPEFKKLLNKGISTPIGIIVILTVAVVVGAGAWYFGKSQTPEPSLSPSPSDTPSSTPTPSPSPSPSSPVLEEPYIEVISPNGGEELVIGENYLITWNNSSDIEKVNIYTAALDQYPPGNTMRPAPVNLIADNVTASGSFEWQITEPEASCFFIMIKDSENESISDVSDECFSIAQKDIFVDWEIYRNEEREYEIKYPKEALLDKSPSETLDGSVKIHFLEDCYLGLDGGPFGIEDPDIEVEGWEDIVVVNQEEHKRYFSRFPNGEIPDFASINLDYSQDENYPHFLIYHSIEDECLPLINQMLSTFKFTN